MGGSLIRTKVLLWKAWRKIEEPHVSSLLTPRKSGPVVSIKKGNPQPRSVDHGNTLRVRPNTDTPIEAAGSPEILFDY